MSWKYTLPVGVVAIFAALYSWLWFDAAARVERELAKWTEKQRRKGVDVTYDQVQISGYPFRLHVTLDNPRIGTKGEDLAWEWSGDSLHAHALPYKLTHVIVESGGTQALTVTRKTALGSVIDQLEGTAASARASLVWTEGLFNRLSADIQGLDGTHRASFYPFDGSIEQGREERLSAKRIQLHSMRDDREEDADYEGGRHRLAVRAESVAWIDHLLPGLGQQINLAEARFVITGVPEKLVRKKGPTDDASLRAWRDNNGAVAIDSLILSWDPVNVNGTGQIKLDRRGRPKGRIDVTVNRPHRFVDGLEKGGVLNDGMADVMRSAVDFVAYLNKDPSGSVSIPVKLKDGRVYLSSARIGKVGSLYSESTYAED